MKTVILKHIANIAAGFPLRGAADALQKGDAHFVQMRNVKPGEGIDWESVARVTLPTKRKPNWLKEGDVIFAARGAKNYAVTVKEYPRQSVCSPHFFVIRINNWEKILPDFLAWQINQKPAQDYFQRAATGSYILNIRRQAIEGLEIVIPPLYKQEMIIALWDMALKEHQILNKLVENRNEQLEAIAVDVLNHTEGKDNE